MNGDTLLFQTDSVSIYNLYYDGVMFFVPIACSYLREFLHGQFFTCNKRALSLDTG